MQRGAWQALGEELRVRSARQLVRLPEPDGDWRLDVRQGETPWQLDRDAVVGPARRSLSTRVPHHLEEHVTHGWPPPQRVVRLAAGLLLPRVEQQ